MKYYTVYKVTNLINGKFYIGKHETTNLEDRYMGSGKILKYAIAKHGIGNFKKEYLFIFNNEPEMNVKEAELVTEEFVSQKDNYNLCPGGKGSFGYINANIDLAERNRNFNYNKKNYSDPTYRKKLSESAKRIGTLSRLHQEGKLTNNYFDTRLDSKEISKLSNTPEAIAKKKETWKRNKRGQGSNNSQYGTYWITNGNINKKIKKDVDLIPEGWHKGRVI